MVNSCKSHKNVSKKYYHGCHVGTNTITFFCLIKCPKYWSFLFFIVTITDLLEIVISRTSSLLLCSCHDILIILLYIQISNASSLF